MDDHEITRRCRELPTRFGDRLGTGTLRRVQLASRGGEFTLLLQELVAAFANQGVHITTHERDDLRALLQATNADAGVVDRLDWIP